MSALIIGGIAFMCGGAIGAAWFVATMKREKSKRKNKRKWYREEKPKHSPLEDLMWTATPRKLGPMGKVIDPREIIAEKKRRQRENDPDALLFETEAAPETTQIGTMGPYAWNTDVYTDGRLGGWASGYPTGLTFLNSAGSSWMYGALDADEAARRIVEVFGHKPLPKERPPGSIRKHPYG